MPKKKKQLSNHCPVAIISGRDLPDVREKVGIDDIIYAGSHGFDIAGPKDSNIETRMGEKFLPLLDETEKELTKKLQGISGALVERKKFSLAIHYRNVGETLVEKVRDTVERAVDDQPRLKMSSGKKVFEVQPAIEWNKGKALLWLLEEMDLNSSDVLPFYIGDDTTDEDAFRSLSNRGVGIVVMENERPTAAHYFLKDPGQVEKFIRTLTKILRGVS